MWGQSREIVVEAVRGFLGDAGVPGASTPAVFGVPTEGEAAAAARIN
jgi:hypothetical protein